MLIRIKLYARLVIEGVMSIEEIPLKYRLAVETEINKMRQS